MIGIENLNQVNVALTKLAVLVVRASQGAEDFSWQDSTGFLATLPAAIEEIEQVSAEIADLDAEETQELLETTLAELQPLGILDPEVAMPFIEAAAVFTEGIQRLLGAIQQLGPPDEQPPVPTPPTE
jgi:hypothetical protein